MKLKRLCRYVFSLGIALDQFGNAALGGFPDETLSTRAARAKSAGKRWGCVFCRLMDVFHKDHCDWSYKTKAMSLARRWSRSDRALEDTQRELINLGYVEGPNGVWKGAIYDAVIIAQPTWDGAAYSILHTRRDA